MRRSLLAMVPGLGAGLALLLAVPAAAAEIEAASTIGEVTVYPDRAEIVRRIEAELPAGRHELVVDDLPEALIEGSLRVEGTAAAPVRIGRVSLGRRIEAELVNEAERALENEIAMLEATRRERSDRIEAQRIKLDIIRAIGGDAAGRARRALGEGGTEPEDWREAWQVVVAGAEEALEAIRNAEEDQAELDRQIDQKRRELEQIRTDARSFRVARIGLSAEEAAAATLELVYQVEEAGWRPRYEARLSSADGSLHFLSLGEVRQATGEAWEEVRLILSTARPGAAGRLPELDPWFLDVAPEPQPLARQRQAPQPMSAAPEDAAGLAMARETAATEATALQARHVVPGPVSLAPDGTVEEVVLDERRVGIDLIAEAVPKLDHRAYLVGRFTHEGEAPLLPGPLRVLRDGAFIGETRLDLVRPDETVALDFGVDQRIEVGHRLDTGRRSREGVIRNYRRSERHYLIEVTNHHDRAMPVRILDQLPVPQDERIVVELLESATPPSERDVDGRRGVLLWELELAPGAEATIGFSYAVTFPEELDVPGF